MSRSLLAAIGLAIALVAASCGGDDSPAAAEAQTGPSATTTAPDPLATPSVEGSFPVADGRKLALMCWGSGSPTVVLDAGTADAGISAFRFSPVLEGLAAHTRVCAYDRAGLGGSDPPPLASDASTTLRATFTSSSPRRTSPAPTCWWAPRAADSTSSTMQAVTRTTLRASSFSTCLRARQTLTAADIGPWDAPENPEHMDYVAIEREMALNRLPIPRIPVTVVTATEGQSTDPEEQRVWLKGSSKPRQVVLDGGHVIHEDNPSGVLADVLKVLESIR